jgi:hypothetical protein
VFSEMKKELRNREAAGWARVAWGLAQKPALNEMAVVHGRLIYLNPKVLRCLCLAHCNVMMDDHSRPRTMSWTPIKPSRWYPAATGISLHAVVGSVKQRQRHDHACKQVCTFA